MSIADKYQEAFTSSLNAQGKGDQSYKKDAEKELERLEREFKMGSVDKDEYSQRKAMLIRKLSGPSTTYKI